MNVTNERSARRSARVSTGRKFRFADLFAGIGGIRLAFEGIGGECVFTSERDKFARQTYEKNLREKTFNKNSDDHIFNWDITELDDPNSVPDHDVLLAGFPCQPFSLAGVSKKNSLGRPHGFEDETQGTLFFEIKKILNAKKPPIVVLENVKNLVSHDGGETFKTIERVLHGLGYETSYEVIDSRLWVPQSRKRIIIVGIRRDGAAGVKAFNFESLDRPAEGPLLEKILHSPEVDLVIEEPYTKGRVGQVNLDKYTLTPRLWEYLQQYATKHRQAGNGFGYGRVGPKSVARTLSARYYKDGAEILVDQGPDLEPRRLTPRECARLMGFPETFKIPVSDAQAYRQFGNSVVVPMMSAIAEALVPYIDEWLMPVEQLAS